MTKKELYRTIGTVLLLLTIVVVIVGIMPILKQWTEETTIRNNFEARHHCEIINFTPYNGYKGYIGSYPRLNWKTNYVITWRSNSTQYITIILGTGEEVTLEDRWNVP